MWATGPAHVLRMLMGCSIIKEGGGRRARLHALKHASNRAEAVKTAATSYASHRSRRAARAKVCWLNASRRSHVGGRLGGIVACLLFHPTRS
eukprot:6191732-Pleurochrysis_carterae.AAC.2